MGLWCLRSRVVERGLEGLLFEENGGGLYERRGKSTRPVDYEQTRGVDACGRLLEKLHLYIPSVRDLTR
jgi:hypothetical protein